MRFLDRSVCATSWLDSGLWSAVGMVAVSFWTRVSAAVDDTTSYSKNRGRVNTRAKTVTPTA